MSELLFWDLLAKKFAEEATPEELAQLDELMRKHPDWLFSAQYLQDLWKMKQKEDPANADHALEAHLARMKKKGLGLPDENQGPGKKRRWLIFSLFTFLVIALGTFFLFNNSRNTIVAAKKLNEVSTNAGSRSRLVLPDGSVVWLNAGSKLSYSNGFGTDKREVKLSGEAYFDIKEDKIPFIIHTRSVKIRVLGTAFNVRSYPDEATTETSLVRGKVEVTVNERPGETYILEPKEKLVISNEVTHTKKANRRKPEPTILLEKVKVLEDSSIVETSWVENRLVFREESFGNVVRNMERWYNIPIRINDPELENERLSGSFENETVVQALKALQITTHFQFKKDEKGITITH